MSDKYSPWSAADVKPLKPAPARIGRKFKDDEAEYATFVEWYRDQFNKLPSAGNNRARAVASLMWLAWAAKAKL